MPPIGERRENMNRNWNHPLGVAALAVLLAQACSARAALSGGDVDLVFNPAISGSVTALAAQPDEKVLIGGGFTSVNGIARTNIARLNADGSLDGSFQNGFSGANNIVRAIVVQPDGKVLVGGGWNASTGTVNYALCARLNTNGTVDTNLHCTVSGSCAVPWSCTQPSVNSVAVQPDGKVLIGGLFTAVNGSTRYAIVRLNSDGSLDNSFTALNWQDNFGNNGSVNSVAVQPDGKMLVGGIFNYLNATARGDIARLNASGTVDTNFLNGLSGADGNVNAVTLQSDGRVLIGGLFSSVNGAGRHGIARLNSDGSLDASFQNGMAGVSGGFISYVQAIAVQSDGKVLIAGGFTTVNGVARNGFARLYGSTPRPSLRNFGVVAHQYGFDVVGESNQAFVVEASADFLSWIPLATNTLGGTAFRFSDPSWGAFPTRHYRARVP